jgi:hypothetical protein
MFNNLHELITGMPDEKSCRDYLNKERWNGIIYSRAVSPERDTATNQRKH